MWALHGLLAYPHDMAAGFPRAMIHLTETETQRERGTGVPSIRRQNASGRLWAKAPMAGGGAGFVV